MLENSNNYLDIEKELNKVYSDRIGKDSILYIYRYKSYIHYKYNIIKKHDIYLYNLNFLYILWNYKRHNI